ncbi:hypothetical protein GOY18_05820 [Aeromonas hydrophila]|uniref:hypothetical protein n=1 Tax=Aeromonas hydrophila TaxID=644 RepID=UPI001C5AEE40|nr:hypothetical protein [Aeromonas hydrophila]EGX6954260.1 hypothetical protein [Aeromonas hydrophila]MBW3809434.1 hypothetical protein [Aeromonas hydrophila]MBW3844875.1 hypothetical protein [Aeromonas hydrophila]
MDLILISEKSYKQYHPNFVIAGREDLTATKKDNYKKAATAAAVTSGIASTVAGGAASGATLTTLGLLGTIPLFTPISMLAGASLAIPAIYKLLTSKEDPESVSQDSINELNEYIARHSLTKNEALDKGFKFPPGHPKVGGTYVPHPLSSYPNSSKKDLYIPEHVFDDILFEEREAELLTLLVKLGAIEVEISKNVNSVFVDQKDINIGANAGGIGNTSFSGEKKIEKENGENDTRTFLLKGKPWDSESKIDRSEYAWLNFEPSWNALITAREIGGCTCASLEIKEASKYISNKNISMQLQAGIYSANGAGGLSMRDLQETSYSVKVKFS